MRPAVAQAQYLSLGVERLEKITISDASPKTALTTIFIVMLTTKGLSVGCARGRWVNASASTVRTKSTAEGTGRFVGSAVCTRKMVRLLNVYGHYFFYVTMLRMGTLTSSCGVSRPVVKYALCVRYHK